MATLRAQLGAKGRGGHMGNASMLRLAGPSLGGYMLEEDYTSVHIHLVVRGYVRYVHGHMYCHGNTAYERDLCSLMSTLRMLRVAFVSCSTGKRAIQTTWV